MMHCGFDHEEYHYNWGLTKALYNVIRADLGKRFCNFRIRPIVLFTLI